jgi:hypothetical protein
MSFLSALVQIIFNFLKPFIAQVVKCQQYDLSQVSFEALGALGIGLYPFPGTGKFSEAVSKPLLD